MGNFYPVFNELALETYVRERRYGERSWDFSLADVPLASNGPGRSITI